ARAPGVRPGAPRRHPTQVPLQPPGPGRGRPPLARQRRGRPPRPPPRPRRPHGRHRRRLRARADGAGAGLPARSPSGEVNALRRPVVEWPPLKQGADMIRTLSFVLAGGLAAVTAMAAEPGTRTFELRTYTTLPGKLDALNARFRDHTNALFAKHGMKIVGFWVPSDKD